MQRIEKTFAGRKLVIETGRMAKQAAGSCLITYGDTMVLATVTVSDNKSPLPFFPLTVEYKEKTYAAGKIPGGFIKREGRPSDDEILELPDHRPLHPPAVPGRLPERSAGLLLRHLGGSGEQGRRARARRDVVRARREPDAVGRSDRLASASAAIQGNWVLNPTLPAARVQRHGARRRRLATTRS